MERTPEFTRGVLFVLSAFSFVILLILTLLIIYVKLVE